MSSIQDTRSGTHPFPDHSSSRPSRASGSRSSTDQEAANLAVGTFISGRFKVVKRLGLGGMGAVYQVEDLETKKALALKVMMPSLLLDQASSARFQREAEVMRSLGGQGIVRVFDIGDDPQLGLKYYSMELLNGLSLRELLNECQDHKRPVDQDIALEITRQTLAALIPAHEQEIIHRDLKPENIFLKNLSQSAVNDLELEDIDVVVLDFGIAKANDQLHLTQTQASFGTAAYMAPEQQLSARKVDHRADQFSIGVILHELLCHRIALGEAASEQEISGPKARALRRFLLRTLQEEPAQRFPDSEATLRAVEELLEPKTSSRSLILATTLLFSAVGLVFGIQFLLSPPDIDSTPAPENSPVLNHTPVPEEKVTPKVRPPVALWEKLSTVDITTNTPVNYSHLSIDQLSSKVYISGQFARGYVTIIDTKNPKHPRMTKRSLGSAVMVVEDADRYYMSSGYQGELLTFSIDRDKEIGRLKIGFCGGYQALDKKRRLLYMASQCGNGNDPVHVFKADTGELARAAPLQSGKVCVSVHVNSKTGFVYVGRADNKTLVFDSGASYQLIKNLRGLIRAIDEKNNRLFFKISSMHTQIVFADTHKTLAMTPQDFGSMAIASSRNRLYTGLKNKVAIRELASLKVLTEIELPKGQSVDFVGCDEKRRLIFCVVNHGGKVKTLEIFKDRS